MRESSHPLIDNSAVKIALWAVTLFGVLATTPLAGQGNLNPLKPDARGRLTYFLAEGITRSGYRVTDAELASWAFEAWQREAPDKIQFERIADESPAAIRLYFLRPARGVFGSAASPTTYDPRISRPSTIYIMPLDPSQMKPDVAAMIREPLLRDVAVFFLCLHEIGHSLGIAHTSGVRDVMRAGIEGGFLTTLKDYRARVKVRDDLRSQRWLTEGDIKQLRLLYPKQV
jgi:hypothetical protein